MRSGLLIRAAAALLIVMLVPGLVYAMRTYAGLYEFMRARRGVHTAQEFEERLWRTIELYPAYGYARLMIARSMLTAGAHAAALEQQRAGMRHFRPLMAYAQMGSILANMQQYDAARAEFEMVARLNPRSVAPLEQLAYIALRDRDRARLARVTDEILRIDMNNVNAWYLRAQEAEQNQNIGTAITYYQRVSAMLQGGEPPRGAVFTKRQLEDRLRMLTRGGTLR